MNLRLFQAGAAAILILALAMIASHLSRVIGTSQGEALHLLASATSTDTAFLWKPGIKLFTWSGMDLLAMRRIQTLCVLISMGVLFAGAFFPKSAIARWWPGMPGSTSFQGIGLIVPAAFFSISLFLAAFAALAHIHFGLGMALVYGSWLLWTPKSPVATGPNIASLLLAVAAVMLSPALLAPVAVIITTDARFSATRRSKWLRLSVIITIPLAVAALSEGGWSGLQQLLFGASVGPIDNHGSLPSAWLLERAAQAPMGIAQGFSTLLLAWGAPLQLVGGLLGMPPSFVNPVTLVWGIFLLVAPFVALLLAWLKRSSRTADASSNQPRLLLLGAVAAHTAVFPNTPSIILLAAMLYPLFVLAALGDLARLPRSPMASRLAPLIILVPLLVGGQSIDLWRGIHSLDSIPSRHRLDVQAQTAETVRLWSQEDTTSVLCIQAGAEETDAVLQIFDLPTGTRITSNCQIVILVLQCNDDEPVANARDECRNYFLDWSDTSLTDSPYRIERVMAFGSNARPGYCIYRLEPKILSMGNL